MPSPERRFIDLACADAANATILERLPMLGLNDCWLVAGCLVGPVWDARTGAPPGSHTRDYDIFYWDEDTSWDAEDTVIGQAAKLFADLDVVIEVRNQARVPLWFEEHFGSPYPPSSGCAENIGRFVVACTCVGMRPDGRGGWVVCAPFGLEDLFDGILRPNPRNPTPDRFPAKCASYRERWPWLEVARAGA
jgi:hypothetical protein